MSTTAIRETINGPITYTKTVCESSGWNMCGSHGYLLIRWTDSKGYQRNSIFNRSLTHFDIEMNELYYKLNELTMKENDLSGYNYEFVKQSSVFQKLILLTGCFKKVKPLKVYHFCVISTWEEKLKNPRMRNLFGMCGEMYAQIKKKSFASVVYISKY
ncbi:hypothetical protein FACS189472_13000 [Alphaproteobacteria bacterium]|nr:hypothetical protein FACS189472_13000 [Alphaproteobacteria bacterium]